MPARSIRVQVTVEREAPPTEERAGRTIRLTADIDSSTTGVPPTAEELHEVIESLTERLESALELSGAGSGRARGPDRDLEELIQTYRPRQRELVELLRAEGELSAGEASQLRQHLQHASASPPVSAQPQVPSSEGRGPPASRSVDELLATYQIASLKQAGAVRARRQISFSEYMALKNHFSAQESSEAKNTGSG